MKIQGENSFPYEYTLRLENQIFGGTFFQGLMVKLSGLFWFGLVFSLSKDSGIFFSFFCNILQKEVKKETRIFEDVCYILQVTYRYSVIAVKGLVLTKNRDLLIDNFP